MHAGTDCGAGNENARHHPRRYGLPCSDRGDEAAHNRQSYMFTGLKYTIYGKALTAERLQGAQIRGAGNAADLGDK